MKFTNPEEKRNLINGWIWLCPILAIALAAWLLVMWGFTWWTALLIALFLVCPAILLWGVFEVRRKNGIER